MTRKYVPAAHTPGPADSPTGRPQVELRPNGSGWFLALDGIDISNAVASVDISVSPIEGAEVVIGLSVSSLVRATIAADARVELDDATVAALTRLGWRPPSEIPGAL